MFGSSANNQQEAPTGVGGKLFLTLFGLVFMGMGLFFFWLVLREAIGVAQTWTWQKTECAITASGVGQQNQAGQSAGNFYFDVKYRYTLGGNQFASDRYERKPVTFQDYGKAARLAGHFPVESSAVCYVNPAAPTEAVLVRNNMLFSLLKLFFPMIFVAIGGSVIYWAWRRKTASQLAAQPISDRAAPGKGLRILGLFFLVFLVMGAAISYGFSLRPLFKIQSATAWPAIPCVVISSEVRSHDGDDGTTYSVNIIYSYEFKGREFKSNTYDFMGGSSSGYAGKQEVVARHPAGSKTVCYVNPDEPTEAVLERGFTPDMWFGLIPLLFVLVGVGGLIFTLHLYRRNALADGAITGSRVFAIGTAATARAHSTRGVADRIVLKPKYSPWAKLFLGIFVCLFWNGLVSVFVGQAVISWRSGHPEWFLNIFLTPFVAVGLWLVGAVFYYFLALFNPRPRLTVTPGAVRLGDTLEVQWNLTGRTGVLQNLRLHLEGREEATSSGGENSNTARCVFANLEIASVTTPREMQSGEARVTIPARLVPTFAGRNNKIIWAIHVHGQIARWPDVDEEFPVTVLPSAPGARPSL